MRGSLVTEHGQNRASFIEDNCNKEDTCEHFIATCLHTSKLE
jgi:hypothetical protein